MSLIGNFKPDEVVDAIPKDTRLTCEVVEAEDQESKNKPGNFMIKVVIEVIEEGPFKGIRVTNYLNVVNSDSTAERIGKAQLKKLLAAVGLETASDNSEFYNKPFTAVFGEPEEFNGDMQSRIRKYEPLGSAPAATGGKPSWKK